MKPSAASIIGSRQNLKKSFSVWSVRPTPGRYRIVLKMAMAKNKPLTIRTGYMRT